MRRALGFILLGLGVFAVALGLLLNLYAYPALAKIPHDPDSTSVAEGHGATALVFVKKGDRDLPEIRDDLHLVSKTHVTGDLTQPEAEEGGDVAVWVEANIVEAKDAPELQPLSGSVRRLCLDRFTGEAVAPCQNQYYQEESDPDKPLSKLQVVGKSSVPQQPGYNFKLPFNTEKKTYNFYNFEIKKTVPLKFEAEDTIKGLDVYRFSYSIEPTEVPDSTRNVPGSLVGQPKEPKVKVSQYYESDRTMWIDPLTGAIIGLEQRVEQRLVEPGQNFEDGTVVTDATLALNDQSVDNNVAMAEENGSKLWLLTTLPVILWIAGPILMIIGILLLIRREPKPAPARSTRNPRTKVGAGT